MTGDEVSIDVRRVDDALHALDGILEGTVDAVVCDPPYSSGAISEAKRQSATYQGYRSDTLSSGRLSWFEGDQMGTAGLAYLIRALAVASRRVLVDGGSLLVFCDWRQVANLSPAVESVGLRAVNLLVWDKRSVGLGNGFRTRHELILHFTKGAGTTGVCGAVSAT